MSLQARSPSTIAALREAIPQGTEAVGRDLLRNNKTAVSLAFSRGPSYLKARVTTIDERSMSRSFVEGPGNGAWAQFYKEYPHSNGLTRVSQVGFDSASGQAMFCVDIASGMTSGAISLVLMANHAGPWERAGLKVWRSRKRKRRELYYPFRRSKVGGRALPLMAEPRQQRTFHFASSR